MRAEAGEYVAARRLGLMLLARRCFSPPALDNTICAPSVAAPLAAKVILPAEILNERTADGGLQMTATEDRLDPGNPEHLRRARILAETLIACAGYSSQ